MYDTLSEGKNFIVTRNNFDDNSIIKISMVINDNI